MMQFFHSESMVMLGYGMFLPVTYHSEGEDVSKGASKDPWQQEAHTLAESIHQMLSLLQQKSTVYLSTTSSSSSLLSNPTNFMKDSE
eukprot:6866599-Ditylum_brightwellii.AAC.1